MAISDLEIRQGRVEVIGEVTEKSEPREFNKFGRAGKVCDAVLKDATGEIKLTLWNEQVDNVKVGNKVHIKNGYVGEWQGEKQLSTGKFGTLEIIENEDKVKLEPAEDKKKAQKEQHEELDEESEPDVEEEEIY